MGIVRELERALRSDGSARPADYACRNCDSRFDLQHHVCPVCGGYSVDRIDWGLLER